VKLAVAAATAALVFAIDGSAPAEQPAADAKADAPAIAIDSAVPDHWRALPELARPARGALEVLGDDVGARAQAWGDPAAGVYALLLTGRANVVARPRDRVAIATDVHDQFRGLVETRGATLEPWTTEQGPRAVRSRAEVEQYGQRGELTMWSGYDADGRLMAAIALCFRNDRVVERTERECRSWLESVRPALEPAPLSPDADEGGP